MRTASGMRAACSECGEPLCFYCAMVDHAALCRTHAPSPPAPPPATRVDCAICGKWPVGPRDSGSCADPGCTERLCLECLSLGARTCPEHAVPDAQMARAALPARTARALTTCAFCGRTVEAASATTRCGEPGCPSVLCDSCVELGEDRCGKHLRTYGRGRNRRRRGVARTEARHGAPSEPTLRRAPVTVGPPDAQPWQPAWLTPDWTRAAAELPESPPGDARIVTAAQARLAIESFFGRFSEAVAQPRSVQLPGSRGVVELPGWRAPAARTAEPAWRHSPHPPIAGAMVSVTECPAPRAHRYDCAERRWLGLGRGARGLRLEARAFVRPERYLRFGGDWEPASVDELADVLLPASREAEAADRFHLLAIFSPTGWSDEARELVEGRCGGRQLVLPGVKAVLVGPEPGDCYRDELDERARELDDLFPLASEGERVALLAERVRELAEGRSGLMLDETSSELGCTEREARAAFDFLAEQDDFEIVRSGRAIALAWRNVP